MGIHHLAIQRFLFTLCLWTLLVPLASAHPPPVPTEVREDGTNIINTPALVVDCQTNVTCTNNAGIVEVDATGSGLTGSGADTRLAYWTGTSALSGNAGLTFNPTTHLVTIGDNTVAPVTLKFDSSAGADDPTLYALANGILETNVPFFVTSATPLFRLEDTTVGEDDFEMGTDGAGGFRLYNIDAVSYLLRMSNAFAITIGESAGLVSSISLLTDGTGNPEVVLPTGSISGTEILNDTVVLTTDTAGDYVASATANEGLTLTGTEGGSLGLQDCAANEILKRNAGDTAWACAGAATAWDAITDPTTAADVAFADFSETISGNTNDTTAITQDVLTINFTNDTSNDVTVQRLLVLQNLSHASGGTTETLLVLDNQDNAAVTTGLSIVGSSSGAVTTAVNVSDAEIATALNIGANDILTSLTTLSSVELDRLDGKDAALIDGNDLDVVLEGHLKAVDAAADEECLTYEATGGDFEWQSCGAGGGDSVLVDTVAITDASGVDLTGGTNGIDLALNAAVSPDTATFNLDLTEVNSATLGSGTFTTLTFDAGVTDPVLTAASGALTLTTGDLGVATNAKLNLEGSAGDTYFLYNGTSVQLYVNNVLVREWSN